jgi:ribonuclease-3
MAQSYEELQKRIGYTFVDPQLLERALTHSSFAFETGEKNHHLFSNERLEFLGDAVLSLLSSEYLYERYPSLSEGELSRMRSAIVCEGALASYASQIGLGDFLLLGKGESAGGGAKKPAILADAFEALLAAIYLDSGKNLNTVAAFLNPILEKEVKILLSEQPIMDPKSRLQEIVQEAKGMLSYEIISESGPDHDKHYVCAVKIDNNIMGRGEGSSKKKAEIKAAEDALKNYIITA